MTRLLQAMAGAEHGGAEAFFERLAMALGKVGMPQQVLIRRNPQRAEKLRAQGVDVVELPFGGMLDFSTGRGFKGAVKRFKPDVVLTWMNRATKFCPSGNFVKAARLGGYYDLKYYRGCDHLIANTEDIRAWILRQGWAPERVHYLPNFVGAETAPPLPRHSFSTPDNAPLALALGRLHHNKAFDVLIKAMRTVPDAYLWIAGEGPLRAELEALATHLGVLPRIRFLGWRQDTAALFAAADLFVCPSRHEPLGNVVIEAWAQGLPVIAAAAQGPTQLIAHGENGVLTPVDDSAAMGEAIYRLLSDRTQAKAMGEAGKRAYQERFTEEAVVARYLDFFAKVTG